MPPGTIEQTILLVDEDLDFLNWATKHLEAKGLRILRCDNGESAIKVVGKTSIDLVIADIQLRPFDGLELLSRLRAKNTNAVVVLTAGFPSTSQIIEATRRGALDVLRKTPMRCGGCGAKVGGFVVASSAWLFGSVSHSGRSSR